MASERFQRRIDRILEQIEDAADQRDRAAVRHGAGFGFPTSQGSMPIIEDCCGTTDS